MSTASLRAKFHFLNFMILVGSTAGCGGLYVYHPAPPITKAKPRLKALVALVNDMRLMRDEDDKAWGHDQFTKVVAKDLAASGIFKSVSPLYMTEDESAWGDVLVKMAYVREKPSGPDATDFDFNVELVLKRATLFKKDYRFTMHGRDAEPAQRIVLSRLRRDIAAALAGETVGPD